MQQNKKQKTKNVDDGGDDGGVDDGDGDDGIQGKHQAIPCPSYRPVLPCSTAPLLQSPAVKELLPRSVPSWTASPRWDQTLGGTVVESIRTRRTFHLELSAMPRKWSLRFVNLQKILK